MTNLRGLSVVYLAEYPDRLKIGRAVDAYARLRTHHAAGATWFAVYPVHFRGYWDLKAEDEALRLAEDAGTRLRTGNRLREEFVGITREEGAAIMREAVTRTEGGPVREVVVDLADLAPRGQLANVA